ncbi:MAG: cation transporter [Clostridia bacterium]|nr:cation transporter [Clostridia bacterium]
MDEKLLSAVNREKIIVKTSLIGIGTNVILAAFKAFVGIISNSIAVTLDAVNNLSDALSSVITVIGAKLAGRAPDKKHPYGHGRIEYLSAMIVSAIVLYAGITSLIESVKKIITPEEADYSTVSLIIIAVAVAVKIILGLFVKNQGKKAASGALSASGADALFDAIISSSVLASALIFKIFGISLEAYVGVLISVMIIKSGFEMITDTLADILGRRADAELTKEIKKIINEEPEVRGAYDLIINNYGPDKNYASVHIELPDIMTVEEVDKLTRKIETIVYRETGVILTGVGVYSYNTSDDDAAKMRNSIQKIVLSHDWALQLHGFHVDITEKTARFDVVISFDIAKKEALNVLTQEVQKEYPDYTFFIQPDSDISD